VDEGQGTLERSRLGIVFSQKARSQIVRLFET
jgi:hypothetical protein